MTATAIRITHKRTAVLVLGALAALSLPAPGSAAQESPASYIVRSLPGAAAELADVIERAGGDVVRTLPVIDGVVAELTRAEVARVEGSGWAFAVTPNASVRLNGLANASGYNVAGDSKSNYRLMRDIGADDMWAKGYTGAGVDVALIDSGVSAVPGLDASRIVHGPDLTWESIDSGTRYLDTYGHGTHMAGLIAGKDPAVSAPQHAKSGDFVGVAPGARIVSVKAADYHGNTDVSQVIAAIDWVVQHRRSNGLNIRVLNLSFGTDSLQSYVLDPLSYAAEVAWRKGIVVVVSAGNNNNNSSKVGNPAINPYVIAVGAADNMGTLDRRDDMVPGWSARGEWGGRIPDVAAPGVSVPSLRVPGSYVDTSYPGGRLGESLFRGSGTSQSAAIVSGAAALLLQQRPSLTPDQVKALLKSTAYKMPWTDPQPQGDGLIDLARAMNTATPYARQTHLAATGTGTLDGARGNSRLVIDGQELRGEIDVFGRSWRSMTMASAAWNENAWNGGYFNGSEWAGNGWDGRSWRSGGWTSTTWTGRSWRDYSWADASWDGRSWRDATWSGRSWRGSLWSSSSWNGIYADGLWASVSWS